MDKLESRYRLILLFSIYKNILSPRQVEYLSSYLELDIGYTEIAEIYNVSRQAVFDNVSKGIKHLEDTELKLGIYQKYKKILDYMKSNIDKDINIIISEVEQIMLETRENV